jgi:lipopolysaccharide export system permease protein
MFGMKMAREDSWPIWQGMWLSVALLTLLGIFLTYKAVNDSVMINPDTWMETLLRLTGKREIRNYSCKEVIMDTPDYPEAIRLMEQWNKDASAYLKHKQRIPFYIPFWKQDFQNEQLNRLLISMDHWIEDLLNTDENLIIGKLMDYPVVAPYRL